MKFIVAFALAVLACSSAHSAPLPPGVVEKVIQLEDLDYNYGRIAYRFDENSGGTLFKFVQTVTNTGSRIMGTEAWWSCDKCLGGFDLFDTGDFGGRDILLMPGESHTFLFQVLNPHPDYLGRYPTLYMSVLTGVPLPASGVMMLFAILAGAAAKLGGARLRREVRC
jgi:hypothetical protein